MKCLNQYCDAEDIESDDNFCYKCGHWTTKGYSFLKKQENVDMILNGDAVKQDTRFTLLVGIVSISFIIFVIMVAIRGGDIFRSFYFIKRQIDSYVYGYNTAIIKTDNIYNKKEINSLDDAKELIYKDLDNQNWKCSFSLDTFRFEADLEQDYGITDVSLCDVSYEEAEKIKNVIEKMYFLFPNIQGALTNISITNAKTKEEYIAYFQPMFQFVNPNENINSYNKVNKTQILLNSYYFLNENIMKSPVTSVVGDNWYVNDATWESTIAHELGHYITFKAFLKQNDLDNIIFVTKENEEKINNALTLYDSGAFSKAILIEALNNYNTQYNTNLDLNTFALTISNYAGAKNKNDELIVDEAIAEAIHDYYLHGDDCKSSSYEIVEVIKAKL